MPHFVLLLQLVLRFVPPNSQLVDVFREALVHLIHFFQLLPQLAVTSKKLVSSKFFRGEEKMNRLHVLCFCKGTPTSALGYLPR